MTGDTICPESPDCEEKLYQYIMSSVSASSSFRCFSIGSDKCSPAGMSFQNSTITFANGITVVCCPVVPLMKDRIHQNSRARLPLGFRAEVLGYRLRRDYRNEFPVSAW